MLQESVVWEEELDPLLHIQQEDMDRATNDATPHVTQSGEQSPMEKTDLQEHAKAGQEQQTPKEEDKGHNGPEMAVTSNVSMSKGVAVICSTTVTTCILSYSRRQE